MEIPFFKYQGTGNDFVVIDNRKLIFPKENSHLIQKICSRKFGVGADGLLLLEKSDIADFRMVYFNADGKLGSMCGNGGRCIVHFAHYLNIIKKQTNFEAFDGMHQASLADGMVSLKMNDVSKVDVEEDHIFLNTGSPHHVQLVKKLNNYEVEKKGSFLRNQLYGQKGSNINFVEQIDDTLFGVRTYERGVEAETLSCGTGATAVAIAMFELKKTLSNHIQLKTNGGMLSVTFEKNNLIYQNIYLKGPAILIYKGHWEC
ncbi:MAG: diaminopimelate epimerase [Flavobacteriaceae bacterium]|jgi:diaminopimelate epimerase|nr:diaminopimelate epimerase [Flavobacteriaceae bacterium]